MKTYLYEELDKILKGKCDDIIFKGDDNDINKIKSLLNMDKFNRVDTLRILRNWVVLTLASTDDEPIEIAYTSSKYISLVTSIIDNEIYRLSGQV